MDTRFAGTSDGDLVAAVIFGVDGAKDEVIRRCWDAAHDAARWKLGDWHAAEDVAQIVCLAIVRRVRPEWPTCAAGNPLFRWKPLAYGMARRRAVWLWNRWTKKGRHSFRGGFGKHDDDGLVDSIERATPEDVVWGRADSAADRGHDLDHMRHCMTLLSPRDRDTLAVVLSRPSGTELQDIAADIGISPSALSVRQSRARASLASVMSGGAARAGDIAIPSRIAQDIIDEYLADGSLLVQDVARRRGLSNSAVSNILKGKSHAECVRPSDINERIANRRYRTCRVPNKLRPDIVDEARRLVSGGEKQAAVAAMLGINITSLSTALYDKTLRATEPALVKPDGAHNKRLNAEAVKVIKWLGAKGTHLNSELSDAYGVTSECIMSIIAGKSWKHVTIPQVAFVGPSGDDDRARKIRDYQSRAVRRWGERSRFSVASKAL